MEDAPTPFAARLGAVVGTRLAARDVTATELKQLSVVLDTTVSVLVSEADALGDRSGGRS